MNLPEFLQEDTPYIVYFKEADKCFYWTAEASLEAALFDVKNLRKRGIDAYVSLITEIIKVV